MSELVLTLKDFPDFFVEPWDYDETFALFSFKGAGSFGEPLDPLVVGPIATLLDYLAKEKSK